MGRYLEAEFMKSRSIVDVIKTMDTESLEDLFIYPAEKTLEATYALNLNTSGLPYHWDGHFQNRADKKAEFLKDYKLATVYLVNRMALNPHGYASQSIGSAAANYSNWVPRECEVLLKKWGQPKVVTRDGGPLRSIHKPYVGNPNEQSK